MRIFGLLGLVAALVIVGLLAKQQLGATRASVPAPPPPAASTGARPEPADSAAVQGGAGRRHEGAAARRA